MNSNGKSGAERTIALISAIESELLSMSDADVLEGQDAAALRKQHQDRLAAAFAEAGPRRLEAARAAMKERQAVRPAYQFTADEARRFARQAANDERYTMAARGFEEMSDDDVIRLCQQLIELGAEPPKRDA